MIRILVLGLLCGLLVGAVILGLGGRIVMSLIMLMEGLEGGWSLGGTLDVVVFAALVGAMTGLLYSLLNRYVPGPPLVKGALAGLLLLGSMLLAQPESAQSAMAGFMHRQVPIVLMFGVVCLLFGIALALLLDYADQRRNTPPEPSGLISEA